MSIYISVWTVKKNTFTQKYMHSPRSLILFLILSLANDSICSAQPSGRLMVMTMTTFFGHFWFPVKYKIFGLQLQKILCPVQFSVFEKVSIIIMSCLMTHTKDIEKHYLFFKYTLFSLSKNMRSKMLRDKYLRYWWKWSILQWELLSVFSH